MCTHTFQIYSCIFTLSVLLMVFPLKRHFRRARHRKVQQQGGGGGEGGGVGGEVMASPGIVCL